MDQRNKWEQELDKLTDQAFKETDSELFNLYRNKLIEIKKSVKYYTDIYPTLSFSKKLEIERQLQVGTEIQQILAATSKDVHHTIENYATNQGELGYNGVFYAIEGAENVTLPFTLINHDYILKAVNKPVAGKRLSKRLYQNQDHLAKVSTQALIDGLWDGNGYPEIAKRITDQTEASYRQALRIARTEGGRVRSLTTQKGYDHAADLGIDFDKSWLATSDSRTRHDHSELNGQTVPHDDQFKIHGHRADGPRLFGVASEDINCRCTTITKIKNMPAEYKNESHESIDAEGKKYDYRKWLTAKAAKTKQDQLTNRTYDKPTIDLLLKHADYIKHLDFTKRRDLADYSGSGYMSINQTLLGLRKPDPNDGILAEINNISNAIHNTTLGEDIKVYRGVQSMPNDFLKNLPDSVQEAIRGSLFQLDQDSEKLDVTLLNKVLKPIHDISFTNKSFMSTSYKQSEGESFGENILLDLEAPKELHGLAVESISQFTHEGEILFDKGYNVVINGMFYDKKKKKFIMKGRITDGS